MKKNILFIFLSLIITNITAQNYPFIQKDLHVMKDAELMENKVQFTENTPMFDEEGNTINPNQINDLMQSGNFVPVVFGDSNHFAKAIVFRKTTKEEKEAIQQMLSKKDPNLNVKLGISAPTFNTKDINGNTINLNDLKNKIVVLNFWFTTCKPCINEIPELNKIKEKYNQKDVIFIAVTFDDNDTINSFLQKNKFNFTIVKDLDILKSYNINNYPTNVIIDKQGKIVFKKIGIYTKILDKTIELLVTQK